MAARNKHLGKSINVNLPERKKNYVNKVINKCNVGKLPNIVMFRNKLNEDISAFMTTGKLDIKSSGMHITVVKLNHMYKFIPKVKKHLYGVVNEKDPGSMCALLLFLIQIYSGNLSLVNILKPHTFKYFIFPFIFEVMLELNDSSDSNIILTRIQTYLELIQELEAVTNPITMNQLNTIEWLHRGGLLEAVLDATYFKAVVEHLYNITKHYTAFLPSPRRSPSPPKLSKSNTNNPKNGSNTPKNGSNKPKNGSNKRNKFCSICDNSNQNANLECRRCKNKHFCRNCVVRWYKDPVSKGKCSHCKTQNLMRGMYTTKGDTSFVFNMIGSMAAEKGKQIAEEKEKRLRAAERLKKIAEKKAKRAVEQKEKQQKGKGKKKK